MLGWAFLAVTVIFASMDAVMALGVDDFEIINTSHMILLLTGDDLSTSAILGRLGHALLQTPAWLVFGLTGFALLLACRKPPKRMFRH